MGAFNQLGQVHIASGRKHIYIDRGSKVLATAHADSVQDYRGFSYDENFLRCATIDNRLGLYIALFHLPRMGIQVDVLITDGEERGNSSAQDFVPDKEYNWMFSFDRMGNDMVMYQYEDNATEKLMESYGFKVGFGSYSDISDLEHLGCKGFNFGCGMQNYHSQSAYADLGDLDLNLNLLSNFYDEMAGERLPHTPAPRHSYRDIDYYDWSDSGRTWGRWSKTGWQSKPIKHGNHYYTYDWNSDRYRRWDTATAKFIYLGQESEVDTAELEVIDLDSPDGRDAMRELWDWEGDDIQIVGNRDEICTCVGCGYKYLSKYVSVMEGEYYCDACLEDIFRKGRKDRQKELVYETCDSCGDDVEVSTLRKWHESRLCNICHGVISGRAKTHQN